MVARASGHDSDGRDGTRRERAERPVAVGAEIMRHSAWGGDRGHGQARGFLAGDARLQTALGGRLCRGLLFGRRDLFEFLFVDLVTGDLAFDVAVLATHRAHCPAEHGNRNTGANDLCNSAVHATPPQISRRLPLRAGMRWPGWRNRLRDRNAGLAPAAWA